jgi:methyl-accepting chemotaxis protein
MSQVLSRAVAVFDRMSVKRQMHSAFAAVLLLMATLGGASLWALIQEDAQARELSAKWLHGVGVLSETRAAVVEARDMEVKHSRTSDRSYHSEYEEKIAASAKLVTDSLAAYQTNAVADEDTKLLAEVNKAWAAYRKASDQVLDLGKQKKQQDAADISDGAAAMALDETLLALNKLTKYNFDGGEAAAAHASATFVKARTAVIGLLGAALALGIGMAWLITRRLYAQLGGEPRVAVQLATAVATGDLSTPIHVESGDSTSLMAQLAAMQRSLVGAVSSVRQGSENVAAASAQIAQGNQDLSSRTEEQAGALQKTASTMDELGSTVRNNADNARQANQLAIGASEVAVKGGEVVGQVVDTMKAINDSSKKIADIISVIDGIAFQTNILALNAAVEAARAGEQGRGFAVVAAEVRSLAQRSAAAAKEIKSLITASVDRVEHGTQLVDQAGQTMEEIVGAIKRVTDIVGEISSASQEQSVGVSQVGEAVTQMDRATQQNAAMVEQSASAAMSLQQQAQQLVQAVAVFKLSASDLAQVAPARIVASAPVPVPAKASLKAPVAPIERRGPNRAKNVERLKPTPKPPAKPEPAKQPASAPVMTGTDDWESF